MTTTTEHLDLAVLEELRAVLGDEFPVLVSTFITDSEKRLSMLRAAAFAANAGQVREAAHSFKGSAMNMGAQRLAALCLDAESRGRSGEVTGIECLIDEIAAESGLVNGLLTAARKD